jgi:hypothetical protein
VLGVCGGKIRGKVNVVERLGLHPSTLRSRMKKLTVGHLLGSSCCPETIAHGRGTGSTWARFSAWRHPPILTKRETAWP